MAGTERERWSSNWAFLLAAVGSAVGLGNLWRFPYLAYKYGGGSFLLPYLIALFVLGIPLLVIELALGQKLQKGAIGAFRAVHPRLAGVGFLGVCASFIVVIYYAVVMAWSSFYLIESFSDILPWAEAPKEYFFDEVLGISTSISTMGAVDWHLLVALAGVWLAIYLCIRKGVQSVGDVVMVTVPLPIILLVILFFRGITLDGAMDGIYHYIKPNFSALLSPEIWLAAAGQIFFTFSVSMGIMIAYASFNKPSNNLLRDGIYIALADAAISIFAGFVVFSVLGYMAKETGQPIEEVAASGPGLAFVVFPKALSLMPLWPGFFSILFFLTLLTLGIDSAFSLVESIVVVICDSLEEVRKEQISFWVCFLCFALGFIFTTDAGLYYLDLVDHFTTNILLVVTGFLECVAIGWVLGAEKVRKYINRVSDYHLNESWNLVVKFVIPSILLTLLVVQVCREFESNYSGFPNWAINIGWAVVILPMLIAAGMAIKPSKKKSLESFNGEG